jgi:hypothetical protein
MDTMRSLTAPPAARARSGNWLPGYCPNPGGRPAIEREVIALARQCSLDSIRTLVEIRDNTNTPAAVRCFAANCVLDRAIGKPREFVGDDLERTELVRALLEAMGASNTVLVRPGYNNGR